MSRTLIADLDGTVLVCGRYYSEACADVAALIAEDVSPGQPEAVDVALVRELIDYLDVWAIRINQAEGFRKERFPRSLAAAVIAAQAIINDRVKPDLAVMAYNRGMEVFSAPYEPFEGAGETLRKYRDAGWRVLILTKGDPEVQEPKILKNGLDSVVDAWKVVPRKDTEQLGAFLEEFGVDPGQAVYVGDSVRDDMTPAKALGLVAVRIETAPEDNWVHEQAVDGVSDFVIPALRDLPTVVPL